VRRCVVAQRLEFQPSIAEEVLEMSSIEHIISVYVTATLYEDIAESKVV
jgi:hypothetical protein